MKRLALILPLLGTVIIAGSLPQALKAQSPRPQCAPPVKHCRIHYVSYSYTQAGRDQFGNRYTRTCHVPAHGKRWCGPWRVK